MRMIPVRPRLAPRIESIKEGVVLGDGALRYKRCTIKMVCTVLKDSVPMLEIKVNDVL